MFDPEEELDGVQRRRYWARHAFSTVIVLTCVSVVAFLLQPLGLPLLLASVVGGAVIYFGSKHKTWWGSALMVIGFLLPIWPIYFLVPSKLLMWIQVVAPLFATVFGLKLYDEGTSADAD